MTLATKYFDVPKWEYNLNHRADSAERVTKPLDPELLETPWRRFVYTNILDVSRLNPTYPWLIQDKADGQHDSTIVYIAGKCFGFRIVRRRDQEGPTDWRENINTDHQDSWEIYDLPESLQNSCRALMKDLKLLYGRLDFIVDSKDKHWFLEVNSNGQYGWLDEGDEELTLHNTVLDAVLDPVNTIPFIGGGSFIDE
jgi:hypothetical protein